MPGLSRSVAVAVCNGSGVLGGSADDQGYQAAVLPTGYVVTGFTKSTNGDLSTNHGGSDVLVTRLDLSGNLIWTKALGSNDEDEGWGYCQRFGRAVS